jgi:energy-coupling factor transport system substrate-specific component
MANALLTWSKRTLPPTVLTLIPIGVAVNLAIGTLVQIIKLPIFLDSCGTVLVAVLAGPLPAIITAVVTVFLGGLLTNPVLPWFLGTAVGIGWFSGYCANRGAFKKAWLWGLCGIIMGVLAAVVSAPVIVKLFGGITQSGSSIVVAYLMATGKQVLTSVLLAGFATDPVDKLITFFIVRSLIKGLPKRLIGVFPRGIQNTQ